MPEDASEVAGVHIRSWQVGYRGLLPDEYLDSLRAEDRAARYTFGSTDSNAPTTIIAEDDGTIVGFVTIGASKDDDAEGAAEILALYADPGVWGQGVGQRLIADARARLRERHFTDAILWVLVGNERGQRFYERDGWSLDNHRRTQMVWGVLVDEIRYRCRL